MAVQTRDGVYRGTREEQQAAFSKDAATAAKYGWVPLRKTTEGDTLRVTYQKYPEPAWVEPGPEPAPRPLPATVSGKPALSAADQRSQALSRRIASFVARGYRVQSQDQFTAVMVTGHRVNHLLHAILTIFLLGLWLFVWIPLAMFGGEKRVLITVDERGNVSDQPA